MIRATFDHSLSRWVTRCTVSDCPAHVCGHTPQETHDEATKLGWTVRHGRGPRCPEHRAYVAPPRRAVEILRAMVESGGFVNNETARQMLREWEAA